MNIPLIALRLKFIPLAQMLRLRSRPTSVQSCIGVIQQVEIYKIGHFQIYASRDVPFTNVWSVNWLIVTSSLLGRLPEQDLSCLCFRTQSKEHVAAEHAGHLYLAEFSRHTSQALSPIEFFWLQSFPCPKMLTGMHSLLKARRNSLVWFVYPIYTVLKPFRSLMYEDAKYES